MKAVYLVRTILAMALAIVCALTVACGAGPTAPPAPIVAVSKTQNPLVANFTVMQACAGQAMVQFGPDTNYGRTTSWIPVAGNYAQASILVAGMKASTTYHMRAQIQCDGNTTTSQDMTFTTGALPTSISFPTLTVTRPNPSLTSSENPGIEMMDIDGNNLPAFFTDRDGNVIWYEAAAQTGYSVSTIKMLPTGHIILSWANATLNSSDSFLQEIDLAGNVFHTLDIKTLQGQLQQAGYDFSPQSFHHDVFPLPNGHLLAIVNSTKYFTDLPGYPGTTPVFADQVIDLDENWNVVWAWNSFDYDGKGLDINRHLNGLPDWTHSNALVYLPEDGNILLSMRHQSWVLKINYANGTGDGSIMWHLGYEGDKYGAGFALTVDGVPTDDPLQWFSFQHFPSLISQNGSQTTLAVWDNGDNRVQDPYDDNDICLIGGTPTCYSRATVFQLDESSMVANLQWADTLPLFGVWGGSINQLSNGNVEFDLNDPLVPPSPGVASLVEEVTQTANPQVVWQMNITPVTANAYRAYRVPSLYPGVTWQF
jgi:arylsulfate sulfotransferase